MNNPVTSEYRMYLIRALDGNVSNARIRSIKDTISRILLIKYISYNHISYIIITKLDLINHNQSFASTTQGKSRGPAIHEARRVPASPTIGVITSSCW